MPLTKPSLTPGRQSFCDETYLEAVLPVDLSSLTRWRQRIGEESVKPLLAVTIEAAKAAGLIEGQQAAGDRGHHSVMPKAVAHPTDSRLLDNARQHLVKATQYPGLSLRQNYNREYLGWLRRSAAMSMPSSSNVFA